MALRAARARARQAVDRGAAQRLPAIRIPNFCSEDELATIDALGAEHARRHGPPVAASPTRPNWTTQYLNADGLARERAPELLDRLVDLATDVGEHFGAALAQRRSRAVRRAPSVRRGSSLADPMHFDSGSIVTLDVMLDEADAGGVFETLEADGALRPHVFERGDAIVFPSYKYHSVSQIEAGLRRVLVMELWQGGEARTSEQHRPGRRRRAEAGRQGGRGAPGRVA
ncbi:hypothetical protein JL722_13829 [Aureococcus anophagefferens]|nr:hypothetical protein JL722_13829 [Aureococcus anophagefferens]